MHRSLHLLSLVSIAVACGCGGGGDATAEQSRAAAEVVIDRGGWLTVDSSSLKVEKRERIPSGSFRILEINLTGRPIADKDLEVLAPLTDLQKLGLHGTRVTDN
ncbi:MAG: hypothetical protein KY476_20965, partial [Planctomycetes bacterium]|nr:hypothetical protein [Planctomycetota bacterium]